LLCLRSNSCRLRNFLATFFVVTKESQYRFATMAPTCFSNPAAAAMLVTIILSGSIALGGAKNFRGLASAPLSVEVADESLRLELLQGGTERLKAIEAALHPVYAALPKNGFGRLTHGAVRYLLHRFFISQHGWYIKGLEPAGDTWNTLPRSDNASDWVPSYLQERVEQMHDRGLDLSSLAAFAAALEDLVLAEANLRLTEVYDLLELPKEGSISKVEAQKAVDTYMMVYLVARKVNISNPVEAELKRTKFSKRYRGYSEMHAWLANVEHETLEGNGEVDFGTVRGIVKDAGEQFGTFNERECSDLRSILLEMEKQSSKPGRVRLVDFYNMTLYSHWNFNEKIEFLRDLGVLDETNASQPMIIVANYVTAPNNCLKATNLYSVCCRDLCEDLMSQLEQRLASPSAPPARIAELVAGFTTATVTVPRELPEGLVQRLEELSVLHGGEVHLHGRLFSQWMHHAFPRECPYPHPAGTTNPQTAEEWLERTGQSATASTEEMQKIVQDSCSVGEAEGLDGSELPWSHDEELLLNGQQTAQSHHSSWHRVFCVILIAAAVVVGLFVDQHLVEKRELQRKVRLVSLLTNIIVVLHGLGMLDYSALVLPLVYSAVHIFLHQKATAAARRSAACEKAEKCLA